MDFFRQLDQVRRINHDDALAGFARNPLYLGLLLVLLPLGLALLGQQIFAAARVDPRFGLWLPCALALCVNPSIVLAQARQRSAVLFKTWIDVLPLPEAQRLQQWRHSVLQRAAWLTGGSNLGLVISTALARQAPSSLLIVAGLGLATSALSLAAVLMAGPRRFGTAAGSPQALLTMRLSGLEPARLRGIGAWQLRRHWSAARVLLHGLLLGSAWVFALAVGRAQAQALAPLLMAVIAASVVFSQSLDGRILRSAVLRCLPLPAWSRFRAWLHAPLLLSALVFAGLVVLSLILLGRPADSGALFWMLGLGLLAWLMLCLLQIVVCLLCPEGGTPARLAHVSGLAVFAVALQSLGPPGLLLMLLLLLVLLLRQIRTLG